MFKLYKLMSNKFKVYSIISIVLTIIQTVTFLVIPVLLGNMTGLVARFLQDQSAANNPVSVEILRFKFNYSSVNEAILFMGIFFGIFLVISSISAIVATIVANYVANAGSMQIRNKLWQHLGTLSQKDLEHFSNSKILTRFTIDIARIQMGILSFLRMMIVGPSILVFGIVFALLTNIELSILFLVIIPILAAVMIISGFVWGPLQRKEQKMYDVINNETQENILGAKVIKSYNMEKIQENKFFSANDKWAKTTSKSWTSFVITFCFIDLFANFAIAFVIYVVGFKAKDIQEANIFSEQIANGVTFINYVMSITFSIVVSSFTFFMLSRAAISSKRIFQIMDKKPDIELITSDKYITNGKIEFDHVTFRYFDSSEKNVLEDISFTVNPGKTLGIIGPTGCGKSTIAKLLSYDFKTTYGDVKIDNHNVKEIDTKNLHKNISHVYQTPAILSGTIKSNLLFAKNDATDEEIINAAKNSCAYEYINKFSEKFNHHVDQKGANLSGGQKQRLSIAQGIIRRPKILILDDSTSALDAKTEALVRSNIKKEFQQEKITTVIIAQKISAIMDADEIIVLNHGKIVAKGSHDELLQNCQLYKEIAISQLGGNND